MMTAGANTAALPECIDVEWLVMGPLYVDQEGITALQTNREANTALNLPTIPRDWRVRDGKVAIVGYGPSLRDTWQHLRGFDVIWTCSKAYSFLLERGIVPAYHTDVDFRAYKVAYNPVFDPRTRFVMGSGVHPSYFERLKDRQVAMFHVILPSGGGLYGTKHHHSPVQFDAGLQTARVAYDMGYRDQHWFGIDAGFKAGERFAGPHDGLKPDSATVYIGGEPWETSGLHIREAMCAEKMLRGLPKLKAAIYGEGLLVHFLMARGAKGAPV